jgi:hypothetical protein
LVRLLEISINIGRVVLNLVTDSGKTYKDAAKKLKENVAKFNQSLMDAALEAGIGNYRSFRH